MGSDTISYINIAKAYASGEWMDAINGCWSPLFSWLIAPFILFSSSPLYAIYISKIISLIIGFFTIISVRMFYNKFEIDILVKRVFLFSLTPVILYFSLVINTPDLLVVLILINYLSIIFDPEYPNNAYSGFLCGFLGALGFLTKSYLFLFFIVHFLLFNLIYFYKSSTKEKKNRVLRNIILGFAVFFIISGMWIGTISDKYGKFTISTAGEYNHAIMGPDYQGHNPLYDVGLIKPPTKFATSIWDEPSLTRMNQWSPFSSWVNFQYQLQLIGKNIIDTFIIIESFYLVSLIIIVLAILFILKSKKNKASKTKMLCLLITIFIYIGGYCTIKVEWRYYWFIFVLIMFMGFYLLDNFYKNRFININLRNILLVVLACLFVIQPAYELVMFSSTDDSIVNLSSVLKTDYGIHGNIASNANWGEMLVISYYLNSKYYGLTKNKDSSIEIERELQNNGINYYFVWNNNDLKLSGYKEITGGRIKNLRIFLRSEDA